MKTIRNFLSSLRVRIMLLVLVATLPALALTFYNGIEQRRQQTEQVNENLLRISRLVASRQVSLMSSTHDLIEVLAEIPDVYSGDPQACKNVLRTIGQSMTVYTGIYVANSEGQVYCASIPNFTPFSIADRAYFQQVLQIKNFVIGNYILGRVTGKPVQPFAAPHLTESGQVVAVVIASVDLSWYNTLTPTLQLPENSALLYVGNDGTILYRYPELEAWSGKKLNDAPLISSILKEKGEGTTQVPGVDNVSRLYAFTPVHFMGQDSGYVTIGVPIETAYAEVTQRMWRDLGLLGLVALVALLIAWLYSRAFILRRINLILQAAQRLTHGDLSARTGINPDQGEIPQLAEAFDTMATAIQQRDSELRLSEATLKRYSRRLERSNRDLQDFAYISSHDLQEPLRKIQAFGERLVLRSSNVLDDEGLMYVDRMQNAAERMQTMINDLLSYSRVSTRAQAHRLVDLEKIAHEVGSDLEIQINKTQGKLEIGSLPTIEAEPTQMHMLLQNLISNALKFHRPEVPPVIRVYSKLINDGSQPENVQIVVEDNGIGFDMKYLERIFLPFQRLHGRSEYPGTGIGLAICRKIVERHGGTLTAESAIGEGTRFIFTLPVRQTQPEENAL